MASQDPRYVLIAEDIRERIQSGELRPGERLEPATALAREWHVSGAVVSQALGLLKAEGLISSLPGRGTFVNAPRVPLTMELSGFESNRPDDYSVDAWAKSIEKQGMKPMATAEVRRIKATPEIADWLEIAEGETVVVRDRVRYADNQAYMLSTSYFPTRVAAGTRLEEPGDQSAPGGLLVEVGHPQIRVRDVVRAPIADGNAAKQFGLPSGSKVWSVVRVGYGQDGRPVRAMHNIAPLDTWQLEFTQTIRPYRVPSPFLAADFSPDPYPGERVGVSFVEKDGAAWIAQHSAESSSGWSLDIGPHGREVDVDSWLDSQGAPPLADRLPLLAYGSNASPGKIDWLRGEGLTGPCVVFEAEISGAAAVWSAGLRVRDDQRPAVLCAANGIEKHAVWWVTPDQREIFDKIEGRGERYRLGWVNIATTIGGSDRRDWILAYVARPEVVGKDVGVRRNRSPLLVGGQPVRVSDVDQDAARKLDGEPGESDGLSVIEVSGDPDWGDLK